MPKPIHYNHPEGNFETTDVYAKARTVGTTIAVIISPEDFRTIGSSPITLFRETPGVLIVDEASFVLSFNSEEYDFTSNVIITISNSKDTQYALPIPFDVVNGSDDPLYLARANSGPVYTQDSIILTTEDGSDATQGDGDVQVGVHFRLIP